MKAIQQIIRHLRARGVLTGRQCAELRNRGFLPQEHNEDQFPPDEDAGLKRDQGYEHNDLHRALIEKAEAAHGRSLVKIGKSGRGGKAVVHKGHILDGDGLSRKLRATFPRWSKPLAGLAKLGVRLGAHGDWRQAVLAIRGAPDAALTAVLAAALGARGFPLSELFAALELEDYCFITDDARGPTVTAYKALLSSAGAQPAGRYRWVLMYDEVSVVANLRSAQRKILRALGAVLAQRPEVIAQCMMHDCPLIAYWALALVYTACRGSAFKRPHPDAGEQHPRRPLLDDEEWNRAWSLAALIDPKAVAPFIAEYHELSSGRAIIACNALMFSVTRLNLDLHDGRFNLNGKALTVAERQSVLEQLATALTSDMIARGAAYFLPGRRIDAADVVDCFVCSDFFIGGSNANVCKALAEVLDSYPGRIANLVCPHSWNWKVGKLTKSGRRK